MKRLFTAMYLPTQGGVYRTLPTGDCLPAPTISDIKPPGCSSFPVVSNNYGALPTAFAQDVEVDEYAWDYRFSSLGPGSQDPVFTDMWELLGAPHQALISITGCYCIGDGIDRPGLTINRPSFPAVRPLPFFRITQSSRASANFRVRGNNPDDVVPGSCCSADDEEPEEIRLEYVGGELKAYRIRKEDKEYRYLTTDVHTDFRNQLGFPRYCCIDDPCGGGHVYRWLHFPRWLDDVHNPYVDDEEPIGVLPVIVDMQCDPDTGDLYVYRANLIFHDGVLHEVRWDAAAPRETVGAPDPDLPPTQPWDLPYDEDYQGTQLLPSLVSLSGDDCDNLCAAAATLLNTSFCSEACSPDTCAAGYTFSTTHIYETAVGPETGEDAIAAAKAEVVLAAPCAPDDIQEPLVACFVKRIGNGKWRVGIAVCCED